MSDRPKTVATLEERTDDIRAILDSAKSESAQLFGVSEGGSMTMLFAATYPQRTRSLALWGALPRWTRAPDYPWGPTPEERERRIDGFETRGPPPFELTDEMKEWFGPVHQDPVFVAAFARMREAGASPGMRTALARMNARIDVRAVLPAIQAPVGSTERVAAVGDAVWRNLLERHYSLARRQLVAYAGVEVDTAGDGLLARFDGPARAIRCARAIQRDAKELGLELRAGVHTGEVELAGTAIRGIAVHTAARIASLAGPGEVYTSNTVRDLVAGSGIGFQDRGVHTLKGIPDPRQVLTVA